MRAWLLRSKDEESELWGFASQARVARKLRVKVTAPAVKEMLKPMYATRHISKDVFKVYLLP